jgi:hypothetical protein
MHSDEQQMPGPGVKAKYFVKTIGGKLGKLVQAWHVCLDKVQISKEIYMSYAVLPVNGVCYPAGFGCDEVQNEQDKPEGAKEIALSLEKEIEPG